MDIATIIGILGGFGLIIGSIAQGGGVGAFVDVPSVIIVFGGTFAVTFIMFPMKTVLGSIKVTMKAFLGKSPDPSESIRELVGLADKARKESLVALEKVQISSPFLKRGIQMVADGTEESLVRAVMGLEIDYTKSRHRTGQNVFKGMGTYAPAFGMIGTLIGLVQMLQNLSDPASIGPAMAVALLTTFYGAVLANVVFLPIANKLTERSAEETTIMEMIQEGVISILNGEHPSIVKEKLNSFLPPDLREG
ncbi:MAG: motility protein A [Desulfovibrionaceae bacterium]